MKPTTNLSVAARNVGNPLDSLRHDGDVQSCAKALVRFLLDCSMAKRIDVSFGRNAGEALSGLDRGMAKRESTVDSIEAMFDTSMFEDEPIAAAPISQPIDSNA